MSIDSAPAPSSVEVILHVTPIPRNWVSKGSAAVPNGQHAKHSHGQNAGGMPLDRWLNEDQNDAPWDNVGGVVDAVLVVQGNGMGAVSAGQQ